MPNMARMRPNLRRNRGAHNQIGLLVCVTIAVGLYLWAYVGQVSMSLHIHKRAKKLAKQREDDIHLPRVQQRSVGSDAATSIQAIMADLPAYDGSHQGGEKGFKESPDHALPLEVDPIAADGDGEGPAAAGSGEEGGGPRHDHKDSPAALVQKLGAWPSTIPAAQVRDVFQKLERSGAIGARVMATLEEFPLQDVRLAAGSGHAELAATNAQYLLEVLEPDRLLAAFRTVAGLAPKAKPYCAEGSGSSWREASGACWEAPDCELRGHFTGHYLSALAMAAAHTDSAKARGRALYIVDELWECQQKIGTGYVSAFPASVLDKVQELKGAWAPYYTLHKVMAGLLDAHRLLGSDKALAVLEALALNLHRRVHAQLQIDGGRRWFSQVMAYEVTAFGSESGGMAELAYQLFAVRGKPEYIELASAFEHPKFLHQVAHHEDRLDGEHCNYHIPLVVSAAVRYELFQESIAREATLTFFDMVNSSRAYATGGTSLGERWHPAGDVAAAIMLGAPGSTETQETCTSYNMIKLGKHLHSWTADPEMAEYLERAKLNAVIGTQRGPGEFLYTLPLGAAQSKTLGGHGWGRPDQAFWCCYGTSVENFAELGEGVYFRAKAGLTLSFEDPARGRQVALAHGADTVYVNQFVSSTAAWAAAGAVLHAEAQLPAADLEHVPGAGPMYFATLALQVKGMGGQAAAGGRPLCVKIRVPGWAHRGASHIQVNGEEVCGEEVGTAAAARKTGAASYCAVERVWAAEDAVQVRYGMRIVQRPLEGSSGGAAAVTLGPLVMARVGSGALPRRIRAALLAPQVNTGRVVSLEYAAAPGAFLAATSVFSEDGTVEALVRRPVLSPTTAAPGGTGFYYDHKLCHRQQHPANNTCQDVWAHHVDALATSFRLFTEAAAEGGGGAAGASLEPFDAPGLALQRRGPSARALFRPRAAGGGGPSVRLTLITDPGASLVPLLVPFEPPLEVPFAPGSRVLIGPQDRPGTVLCPAGAATGVVGTSELVQCQGDLDEAQPPQARQCAKRVQGGECVKDLQTRAECQRSCGLCHANSDRAMWTDLTRVTTAREAARLLEECSFYVREANHAGYAATLVAPAADSTTANLKGVLLAPLNALHDETYSVYFNKAE